MLYIIYIFLFLAALAELFIFKGSIVWAVGVIVVCVSFILLTVLLKGKLPKKLQLRLSIVGIGIAAIFMLNVTFNVKEDGLLSYTQKLAKITEYLSVGEYSEAADLLESVQEEYGENDTGYILSALYHLSRRDVLAAKEDYNYISNRTTEVYYALGEQIYINDFAEDALENLYNLYIEAANEFPTWGYMQFWAGVTQFERKNYKSAQYYLLNAYYIDSADPSVLYYLGAVSYAQNDYEAALEYFDASVGAGANETICGYIAWYLQEMNY